MSDDVLATIEASAMRRWIAIGMLGFVGFVCLWISLSKPPSGGYLITLLGLGVLAAWMAWRLWSATEHKLILTEKDLRSADGMVLAEVADIEALDRGFFAFKPTHGFLIKTKTKGPKTWRPGMWWRMGRSIGVGGVTPGSQSKFMAEMLSAMIAKRDLGDDWVDPFEDFKPDEK
jgi:hypothetical protein